MGPNIFGASLSVLFVKFKDIFESWVHLVQWPVNCMYFDKEMR